VRQKKIEIIFIYIVHFQIFRDILNGGKFKQNSGIKMSEGIHDKGTGNNGEGAHRDKVLKVILAALLVFIFGGACGYAYISYKNMECGNTAAAPEVSGSVASAEQLPKTPAGAENKRVISDEQSEVPSADAKTSSADQKPAVIPDEQTGAGLQISADVSADTEPASRPGKSGITALYPKLYSHEKNIGASADVKVAYLTFDDGPSAATVKILDTLKKYNVKATFFVVGRAGSAKGRAIVRRAAAEGHTIAVHSLTHNYKKIYASPEAFLNDFKGMYDLIYEITGKRPTLFRFPGGSVNSFNLKTRHATAVEMLRRGFPYYDWNVYGGDAEKKLATPAQISSLCLREFPSVKRAVILLHDGNPKNGTAGAVGAIIKGYRSRGYRFEPLTPQVKPILLPQWLADAIARRHAREKSADASLTSKDKMAVSKDKKAPHENIKPANTKNKNAKSSVPSMPKKHAVSKDSTLKK
jgi:peptidoglycan/xylan/chitin deacetylase (PgdA/CDA1 family)